MKLIDLANSVIIFLSQMTLLRWLPYLLLFSAYDKAKLYAKNILKDSNLDDLGISLPVFLSRTNLKLHNVSVTPEMVKKVIINLDSSKVSGPDCIPVVVLENCEVNFHT